MSLLEEFGGARLLISDIRTAFMLANAARHRLIARLFAVPEEQENLLTLILVVMLAEVVHGKAKRLLRVPAAPSVEGGLFGSACAGELLRGVAGPASRETPNAGTLLMLAVAGGVGGPVVVKGMHGIQRSSRRVSTGFHRRYGYLVDPGALRQRRGLAQQPR